MYEPTIKCTQPSWSFSFWKGIQFHCLFRKDKCLGWKDIGPAFSCCDFLPKLPNYPSSLFPASMQPVTACLWHFFPNSILRTSRNKVSPCHPPCSLFLYLLWPLGWFTKWSINELHFYTSQREGREGNQENTIRTANFSNELIGTAHFNSLLLHETNTCKVSNL